MKRSFIASVFVIVAASTVLIGCDQKVDNSLIGLNQCNINKVKNEQGDVVSETRSCTTASLKEIMASTSLAFKEGSDVSISVDYNGKKIM